jgi:hypothetical protein
MQPTENDRLLDVWNGEGGEKDFSLVLKSPSGLSQDEGKGKETLPSFLIHINGTEPDVSFMFYLARLHRFYSTNHHHTV